jgi:hypothetical protein
MGRIKRNPLSAAIVKSKNTSLNKAGMEKDGEFYTQLNDIENELKNYRNYLKGKVVYCNCDDPRVSNFFHYFSYNFERLQLKKLISSCYKSESLEHFSRKNSKSAIYLEYDGDKNGNKIPDPEEIGIKKFKEDGDFRSEESLALLEKSDVIVTNPPFSLFREFIATLIRHKKKFIVIGPISQITSKEIFELIMKNKIWLGYGFNGGNAYFKIPSPKEFAQGVYDVKTGLVKFRNVAWYTNIEIPKRNLELPTWKNYNKKEYPTYANYPAIEVGKVKDIPCDYDGEMGVPITFLDAHNPEQFEIIGSSGTLAKSMDKIAPHGSYMPGGPRFYLKNKDRTYHRLWPRLVIRKIANAN